MTKTILSLLVFAAATVCADERIESLQWLSGCWAADGQEQGSIEYWMTPTGGTMFGIARTVHDDKTTSYEFMRIVTKDNGDIVFVASPANQATTTFALKHLGTDEVAFENLQHDFPQIVIYRLAQPNHLIGRIEGDLDGEYRSRDFPMTKISCDADIREQKR